MLCVVLESGYFNIKLQTYKVYRVNPCAALSKKCVSANKVIGKFNSVYFLYYQVEKIFLHVSPLLVLLLTRLLLKCSVMDHNRVILTISLMPWRDVCGCQHRQHPSGKSQLFCLSQRCTYSP